MPAHHSYPPADERPDPDEYEDTPPHKLCEGCSGFGVVYNYVKFETERCSECRGTGRNDS